MQRWYGRCLGIVSTDIAAAAGIRHIATEPPVANLPRAGRQAPKKGEFLILTVLMWPTD